ncbi:MAG: V-type ATPase subunit [Candidatus Micrarchaeota archaeon]|nr:V-type ATPase subunit [Candidatus Micrarchaeota archaeon]
MAQVGYGAARLYGYSNSRVKAMESKMLNKEFLKDIYKTDDMKVILAKLLQTDYKPYIEEFGDINEREELLDFALRRSLAKTAEKVIAITPKEQRDIIIRIVSKWDLYNIKLVLSAKANGKSFDSISKYIVSSENVSARVIKEAMAEANIEYAVGKLVLSTPYRQILDVALDTYRKTGNITLVNAEIDKTFFSLLGGAIYRLSRLSYESAMVVKLDIEMRNVRTLLRAKKYGIKSSEVSNLLITNGITTVESLVSTFDGAKDMRDLVGGIKSFDLKEALAAYESNKFRQMLAFEIAMRNKIFEKVMSTLKHSVLSFGTIVAYFYLKEIEIFALRVIIKGKMYGLSEEEINGMIRWAM